jgi:hypothetical protein
VRAIKETFDLELFMLNPTPHAGYTGSWSLWL